MMRPRIFRLSLGFTLLSAALIPALSCQRVMPVRTLPSWVRGIYVPMFQNESFEPGLEELVTRLTQEEFLADGRVQVVRKSEADLQLIGVIKAYQIVITGTDSDDITEIEEIRVITELALHDPLDDPFDPGEPVAELGQMITRMRYNSDPRSIGLVIEPDAKQAAMGQLARQVVFRTITGFPIKLRDAPSGLDLPQYGGDAGPQGNVFRNKSTDVYK
jgi:hypothetical protein